MSQEIDTAELVAAAGERWTLVFVREFRQAPAVVWAALTEPEQLDRWAPFVPVRHLGSLGETTLTMVDGAVREPVPAVVLRAEAPVVLEYSWGADLLRWELEDNQGGTRLILRHTLSQPGSQAMVAAGWHLCADVLRRLLDGRPAGVIRGSDAKNHGFEELRAAYAKKFEI
ncbi:SRPBCC domain-containing protein [Actinoplanes sp. NPDC048796]|uniref:SRPBCC domain-containing protein n=1 Tax=Actinoplanes sp. NPDC048796 TaxID=3155640 RepID=UPI0033F36C78